LSRLPRLLVITDRKATGGRPLRDVVSSALAGGARLVQLREKDLEGGELFSLAESLVHDCRSVGAKLLVNDRIDVALAVGADGVVLPADSFPTSVARQLCGDRLLVGRSTHSRDEVDAGLRDGCDFALFGPVFATPSKSAFGPPQGIDRLAAAAARGLAVYAVGGITAENAAEVMRAGAYGAAVIREVMAAEDPGGAVARLSAVIG